MQDTAARYPLFSGKSLSPENLAEDFGPGAEATRDAVQTLYEILVACNHPETKPAVERWELLASGAYGHLAEPGSRAAAVLAECYGLSTQGLRPAEMLFAVQTYYALVVKLLVAEILTGWHDRPTPADRISRARSTEQLRHEMQRMEAGSVLGALDLGGASRPDPFSWYVAAWNEAIGHTVRRLADRLLQYDADTLLDDPAGRRDLFKGLYGSLFARQVRHGLGEYYTPDWLVRHVLDEVGYRGEADTRLLDPACGSGAFLVSAINRIRARQAKRPRRGRRDRAELCGEILASVAGFDLNPLAVLSARANYLIAIGDLLPQSGRVPIPVFLGDSILGETEATGPGGGRFDYVVGNPPWIAWDDLPEEYRRATKPLWQSYGLFTLSGSEARHGGGKKDLSMLMLYAAADRYLKPQGRLAMIVTQTLFQTKGAGDGFRRFRLGEEGPWLRVLRVHDLADFQPFPGAANWTATILLEKGSRTIYPVPYVKWSLVGKLPEQDADPGDCFRQRRYLAEPIDRQRPTSPWMVRPESLEVDWARLVGPSDYQAHLGANSGGANGVYWVTVLGKAQGGVRVRNVVGRSKRRVAAAEHVVEPDLLYPLVRWADVARYRAAPSAHVLLVQDVETRRGIDEATLRGRYPKTYAYLKRFASVLRERAAYKRYQQRAAFYSMYDVGQYTVAPIKVVWRRMDRRINAAVVEAIEDPLLGRRPAIPQETCVLVAAGSADEAHYLCAALNSSVVGFVVRSHSVRGGKGFGTPSMLDYLRVRRFDPADQRHVELAESSRLAHEAALRGEDLTEIQGRIDHLAGRLWGLGDSELDVICREANASG